MLFILKLQYKTYLKEKKLWRIDNYLYKLDDFNDISIIIS